MSTSDYGHKLKSTMPALSFIPTTLATSMNVRQLFHYLVFKSFAIKVNAKEILEDLAVKAFGIFDQNQAYYAFIESLNGI